MTARAARKPTAGSSWDERCSALFEDLRKPARVMIARAFGGALSADEVEDVYASAWTSTLQALRRRGRLMSDRELRAYLLTAVANHASKEMRRRGRRPTSPLDDAHSQVLADSHQPSPEERALGGETGSLARDVLSSLPVRRRAVMLLRYGWGLSPSEVCGLIDGLSPRAYRREITRGVEEVITRLKQVESGEWCSSREPMIRDYVAGTADREVELQVRRHLGHCRRCGELVGRIESSLHEFGSALGWTAAVGALGERRLSLVERLEGLLGRGRETAAGLADGAEGGAQTLQAAAAAGGTRGAGAAGLGIAAKLAGLGAAGKAAVACIGASVVAGACVAGGVVPGIGADPTGGGRDGDGRRAAKAAPVERPSAPAVSVDAIESAPAPGTAAPGPTADGASTVASAEAPAPEPGPSPEPEPPPEQQEFGLAAPVGATGAPVEDAPGGAGGDDPAIAAGGGPGGGSARGGSASQEFGP